MPFCYAGVVAAVSLVWGYGLGPEQQRGFLGWASTNVANLTVRPVTSMIVSAFVAQETMALWSVMILVGLGPLVHRFGNMRSIGLVLAAHVTGTLISQGITALRLAVGAAPDAVRYMHDVGPSYVVVSAQIAVVFYGHSWWHRAIALGSWLMLAPFLFGGLGDWDVAAIGHLSAMITGAVAGGLLVRRTPATLRGANRDAVNAVSLS
ncbi:hypothetical protein GCM10010468_02770 [Actinocorallia longicatena]|uniref:Rhomboid family protein n=1 Tax=Actinocorallia longicatena TaxID=111803 RepID=A0ABP6PW32_9ACTN